MKLLRMWPSRLGMGSMNRYSLVVDDGANDQGVEICPVVTAQFDDWFQGVTPEIRGAALCEKFLALPGEKLFTYGKDGKFERIYLGVKSPDDFLAYGALPRNIPPLKYKFSRKLTDEERARAALGWGMGAYHFDRYLKKARPNKLFEQYARTCSFTVEDEATLLVSEQEFAFAAPLLEAIYLVRDAINIPAGDLTPEDLAALVKSVATEYGAEFKITRGTELEREFPAVYAVGKGSENEPLLIELNYDSHQPDARKLALVGKGVCFDSGGLQLKPAGSMMLMKKDMAGAVHALALAKLVMGAKLPIDLRVIIPAVENLPSGHSLKTGDIIRMRCGLTVEVDNTDAEGRLILADALALAQAWNPELIIDFATLTGAARAALGNDITAVFTTCEQKKNAPDWTALGLRWSEDFWPLPLYQPYLRHLDSPFAELKNIAVGSGVGGGAILGALFLQQFINEGQSWIHLDMNAYNERSMLGRPRGGEACCLLSLFEYLKKSFSS